MDRRPAARALLLAAAALLLVAAGWLARGWATPAGAAGAAAPGGAPRDRPVRLKGFRLVSPLLDVELPEGYSVSREPIPFKYKVKRFVEEQIAAGKAADVSVYYRDLLDGPWFGVNEKRKYNPASMMKVPVMIAWLKRAERDPAALRRSFLFDPRIYPGTPQLLPPERSLADGERYSVEELLEYMVAHSDNKAMWLLYQDLRPEELADVLDSMDVTNDPADEDNAMSAHGYSGFFRILFNAAYLNREMSERALKLLTRQDFPDGMVAGVPRGVTIASKYGVARSRKAPDELQLHEFGIVYHPRGPYILGVMTAGRDWDAQAELIREVSALVYEEIERQGAAHAGALPPPAPPGPGR